MHSLDRQKIAMMMCLPVDHENVGTVAHALDSTNSMKFSIDRPDVANHLRNFFRGNQHKGIQWYPDANKEHVTWFKVSPNVEFARFVYDKLGKQIGSAPVPIASDSEGEHSGLSVNYYQCPVMFPTTEGRDPYTAECNDIIEALGMTPAEANIFKEIWRTAAARTLGRQKHGHDMLYAYEKVFFFAKRQYELLKFKLGK